MTAGRRRAPGAARADAAGRIVAVALTAALLCGAAPAVALAEAAGGAVALPATRPVTIRAHPLSAFRIGRPQEIAFGALDWIGGFEVEASSADVGGLSGLVVTDGGRRLLALSDNGRLFRAAIRRDAAGVPVGFDDAVTRMLADADGRPFADKHEADTESLDLAETAAGPIAYVSFEGWPRVMRGPIGADGLVGPLEELAIPAAIAGLRYTKGLESLAIGPAGSALAGRVLVLAERPPRGGEGDEAVGGDRPGWVFPLSGSDATDLRFTIADDGFDLTDAKVGPDGRLYVLERLFTLADGVRARIRRFSVEGLADGARLDGETIFDANLSHQIDNMEGLAIWTDAAGRTILSLVSDDNRSFLQRTLYLEFVLAR